ncbi:MAG: nicotinamide-nucleotide amidohydrolase family protein, partial [Gemmatimonadota bacterium]
TTGLPESELAARLDDLVQAITPVSIAFLPSVDGIDLRLTSPLDGSSVADRDAVLDAAARRIRERLADEDGVIVYGTDGDDLAARVGRELAERGLTLAVAESCTAGLVAERLTRHPGASTFLLAGVVAYADDAKLRFLDVDPRTLASHGAVSGETVREMLSGVRRAAGADAALAVTGIAGPGGGSEAKPVGTVWFAASIGEREAVRRVRFPGGRTEVRSRSAQAVLALLWRLLHDREDDG